MDNSPHCRLAEDEVILYEWNDGDSCLIQQEESEDMVVRQLGLDGRWYDIDYIEGYSPFVDLIIELLEHQEG